MDMDAATLVELHRARRLDRQANELEKPSNARVISLTSAKQFKRRQVASHNHLKAYPTDLQRPVRPCLPADPEIPAPSANRLLVSTSMMRGCVDPDHFVAPHQQGRRRFTGRGSHPEFPASAAA
jgi:hypothetical protein